MTYSDKRAEVPEEYWADDCPCALAGEYQPTCTRCPNWPALDKAAGTLVPSDQPTERQS